MSSKVGFLDRLKEGPVVGDGGMIFTLERRGYVRAGDWTPQCNVQHSQAG